MTISTISTTITKEVELISSGGSYANPLTITASGRIIAPAPDTSFQAAAAIYVNLTASGSIDNLGIVSGAIPSSGSYAAPAIFAATVLNLTNSGTITGQSGVYLQAGGTVTNSGTIAGSDTRVADGYGVRLIDAALANTGTVYGKAYGVAELDASRVVNHGIITGEDAGIKLIAVYSSNYGTVVNTGTIRGGAFGITEIGAMINNSGTITGQTYGIRSEWGGVVTNSGEISAATDGVLLLNEKYLAEFATTLTNSGTILGSYFGIAMNAAVVTNAASGLISSPQFGVGVGDLGSFYNAGTVTAGYDALAVESGGGATNAGSIGAANLGVELFSDASFTNTSTGAIYSQNTAALDQAAYFANAGRVVGNIYAAELLSGGILINSGSFASSLDGIYLSTLSATASPDFLANMGNIYGRDLGVKLRNGTVYNYGVIRSAQTAVNQVTGTSFKNSGNVYGAFYGVQLAGGTVVNSGSIGGGLEGVRISGGGVTNYGTIDGLKYAIYGSGFSLTVDPAAVFKGNVLDKSKTSRLDLAGSTPGTLTGLGAQFNGFDAIDFESGAQWLISGTTAALAAKQAITGFEQGDTIILTGFTTSDSFVSGTGMVLSNGSATETLDIAGSFTTANFNVTSNSTITTVKLKASAPCFVAGTRILTPDGEIPGIM